MVHRLRVSILAMALMCFAGPATAGELTVEYQFFPSEGSFWDGEDFVDVTGGSLKVRFGGSGTPPAAWTHGEILTWKLTVGTPNSPPRTFSLAAPLQFTSISGTDNYPDPNGYIFGGYTGSPGALLASGGRLTSVTIDDFFETGTGNYLDFARFSGATPNGLSFSLFDFVADEVDRQYLPEPTGGILLASGAVALLGLAALRRRSVGRAR